MAPMGVNQLLKTEIKRALNRVTLELRIGVAHRVITPLLSADLNNSAEGRFLHTLLVNPSDISQSWPSKNQTVETIGGHYTEEWGAGAGTISMQGITGWHLRVIPENGTAMDGYQEFQNLKAFILRYFEQTARNRRPDLGDPVPVEMRLHLWEDDEHYHVVLEGPDAFRKLRNNSQPLLYAYSLTFKVVAPVFHDLTPRDVEAVVGYQLAQAALSAMDEASAEMGRWLAVNGVGTLGFMKGFYDGAQLVYDQLLAAKTAIRRGLNVGTQITGVLADAVALSADLANMIYSDILFGTIQGAMLGFIRPARRALCATRNLVNAVAGTGATIQEGANQLRGAFNTDAAGC